MHPDDGDEDDAPVFGAPLPPEDRLWRHPSEMALLGNDAAARRSGPMSSTPRVLGIAVVSGLLGAVLAVGVVAATVGLGTDDAPVAGGVASTVRGATLVASTPTDGDGAAVAKHLAASVARVLVGAAPAVGSAIVLRDDGYLVTDAALIGRETTAMLSLDGEQLTATVVGTDPATDVAVLHVDRTDLHAADVAASDASVGERTFVVGANAMGDPAVTAGVVSVLDRKITSSGGVVLHGMIQTDAPIDATAIGGALTDGAGDVLALVSGPASATGGYAVPIATARAVADDIITHGHARHVWLGVEGTDLDRGGASTLHVAGGASVTKVADGSPASAAGLQDGDVITAVGGTPVTSMSDLVVGLRAHDPGDTVEVEYWRDGERHSCNATLAERNA
jgi:putative serine protease PepD